MNQSLLEILLVFFSEPPKSEKLDEICLLFRRDCKNKYQISCRSCLIARCNTVQVVHENLNQLETTIRVITNEHTSTPNNK